MQQKYPDDYNPNSIYWQSYRVYAITALVTDGYVDLVIPNRQYHE